MRDILPVIERLFLQTIGRNAVDREASLASQRILPLDVARFVSKFDEEFATEVSLDRIAGAQTVEEIFAVVRAAIEQGDPTDYDDLDEEETFRGKVYHCKAVAKQEQWQRSHASRWRHKRAWSGRERSTR